MRGGRWGSEERRSTCGCYANLGVLEVVSGGNCGRENSRLRCLVVSLQLNRRVLQEVDKKTFSGVPTPRDHAMGSGVLPT
jgi:hypothetical protein